MLKYKLYAKNIIINRLIMSSKLQKIVESPYFIQTIMGLIILNSLVLGLKSYPSLMERYGFILDVLDDVLITIFVCELILYLLVYGPKQCFTDPWYVFDFVVITIVILPAIFYILSNFFHIPDLPDLGHFSALRAMRVLRVLRLVTAFPNLRKVVQGVINAIPGIGSIGTLLMIVMYVFALIGTNQYGEEFPNYFGTLQDTLFTLFQVMTAESWASAIARPILEIHPYSWIFFVMFILSTTFIILNLFIAIIVGVMQKDTEYQEGEEEKFESLEDIKIMLRKIQKKLDIE